MTQPSIALVTICREPLAVTLRFLAWHRHLGVDRVLLYLDDPHDPILPWIEGKSWVRPILCTPAFWAGLGVAPQAAFAVRQLAALTHGYRSVRDGWVAVADADELFFFGSPLSEVLAAQPATLRGLRIATAEHVGTEAPGLHFRLPMSKAQADAVYGPDAGYFRPTEGLIGHRVGKSITRAGLKLRRMRPHWAVSPRERDLTDAQIGPDATAALLHFATPDFEGWRAKLPWRLAVQGGLSPRIKRAVNDIMAKKDPDPALRDLFSRLYRMDAARLGLLHNAGVHLVVKEDILAITREHFPAAPDLKMSPAPYAIALARPVL